MSTDDPIFVMQGDELKAELERRAQARKLLEEAERVAQQSQPYHVKIAPRAPRVRPDAQEPKRRKATNREKRRQKRQAKKTH